MTSRTRPPRRPGSGRRLRRPPARPGAGGQPGPGPPGSDPGGDRAERDKPQRRHGRPDRGHRLRHRRHRLAGDRDPRRRTARRGNRRGRPAHGPGHHRRPRRADDETAPARMCGPICELVNEQLAAVLPQSALEELRRQNQDLISALEDLKQQKDQLLLLNAELQETNRGVMALYSELSNELEQTNRGVVALYAELDEKSERLRAASESKDRFWANVSHELRTPLNSIIGLTRLLAEPGADGGLDPGAALPGRAHQEFGQHPAGPGQRPARRGQGRVGTAARRPGERRPAGPVRPAARAGAPDGGRQAGRGDRQRRRRPRYDPDRRGCLDQHPA